MNLPVKKIEVVVPNENLTNVIDGFQEEGCLEIIPEKREYNGEKMEDYKLRLSEVNFALTFLGDFKPKENFAKSLIFSFVPIKEELKKEELLEIVNSSEIKEIVIKCAFLEEKINKLETQKEKIQGEIDVLERFYRTSVFLEKNLKTVEYFAGLVDGKDTENFVSEISKGKAFYFEEGDVSDFSFNFVLYYQKKEKDYFLNVLKKYNAKEENVFWEENPSLAIEKRKKEVIDITLELDIQHKEVQKLLYFIPKMQALADWLSWEFDKDTFLKETQETKKYTVINAWIAKENISRIKDLIKKETDYFLIKELPLKKDDNPPVIIKNEKAGTFGIVTGVYGLPKGNEIDPTPYLAPFFIFYFALALSDSGYGILLAALSFIAKKVFKKAGADKFFNLFIICGILTAVVGLFVGTIFGKETLEVLRIADPMSDPIGALLFVLALGVFQIFVGLVIGMVWLIKKGEFKEAVSGNGASVIFFVGAILFLITNNINFLISGVISMVILSFFYSSESGIFKRVGKALGSVYGLIGYVGDILSYSRILALGLATGIIAAVINMIALIFKEMIPIPGLDLFIAGVVLVVGHIGNLLINALGAFIHAARLQFVEFFSKFMEGGGRYFKPLEKNGRYIKVIN
jgi:V/A-type H+/Na+-transporting ATPase subunit I